jgi:DNA-binding NarL/FixJ family response regulator
MKNTSETASTASGRLMAMPGNLMGHLKNFTGNSPTRYAGTCVNNRKQITYSYKGSIMIKIGIVDDHAIVRTGLKQFFSEHVDLRVAGEAASGREAIDLVRNVELDILVMDLSMPGQSGIDALAMIRAKAPDVGILILSGYPEEHYAVSLIRQGASGYLNKECDPQEIVDAIRVISLGKRYITPSVAELLAQQLNRPQDMASHEQLSEREFQVFLKLAKGQTAGDIAKALSLSVKTVSTYRTRVMEKMSLASNSDLTYYALKNKLID